jgi:hypothetical protein
MLRKKLGGQIRLTDPERRRGEADADLSASVDGHEDPGKFDRRGRGHHLAFLGAGG